MLMRFCLGSLLLIVLGVAELQAEDKKFFAFRLGQDSFLYRRPLLASGNSESTLLPLKKGTELLIMYTTSNKEWYFVRSRHDHAGWVPKDWVSKKIPVDPTIVRVEFMPKEEELLLDPEYEWKSDVEVWGDELLLKMVTQEEVKE